MGLYLILVNVNDLLEREADRDHNRSSKVGGIEDRPGVSVVVVQQGGYQPVLRRVGEGGGGGKEEAVEEEEWRRHAVAIADSAVVLEIDRMQQIEPLMNN